MPRFNRELVSSVSSGSTRENTNQDETECVEGNRGKKFLNFIRRKSNDTAAVDEGMPKQRSRKSRNRKLGFERRNIHLSRPCTPSTPVPIPGSSHDADAVEIPYIEPKLLKHLTTSLEHEIEHTSNVVQEMQANKAEETNILSVYNVMRQLTRLRLQLTRFQDQPRAASIEIGASRDIQKYLENVETVCDAAKEIVLQYSDDLSGNDSNKNTDSTDRVSLHRSSGTTSLDNLVKQIQDDFSEMIPLFDKLNRNNTKEKLDSYRRKNVNHRNTENKPNNKLHYESGTVVNSSDTDTDEEMSNITTLQNENQKYQWPKLDTKDENRIQKEKKYFSLMCEIDNLMTEVGLTKKKKASSSNLTYEVVMMGSGEMNNSDKSKPQKKSVAPKFAARTFKPTKEIKTAIKSQEQDRTFDDELDRLLDECEFTK